jgi:hypothetical protein
MVWHLILDQQVPGSNPGEATDNKHIKEHYAKRYGTRRNVFYFHIRFLGNLP